MEIGVQNADLKLVRKGAVAAVYWYFYQYAIGLGCPKVSFMWSPPFLKNGVLRFKSKYRPTYSPVPANGKGILLIPSFTNKIARRLLTEQPFLQMFGDELKATAFIEQFEDLSQAKESLIREIKNVSGVAALEIVLLTNGDRGSNMMLHQRSTELC
jgi:hypothetical protein